MAVVVPVAQASVLDRLRRFNYAPLLALLVLVVISAAMSEPFRSAGNALNILRQASYFGIVALGMTFVIIGGGIDLSVGSMLALVGYVAIRVLNAMTGGLAPEASQAWPVVVAGLAALALGAVLGLANGLAIAAGRIAPFIVTLGTLAIFRSMALYLADAGELRSVNAVYGDMGASRVLGVPTPIWVFLGLAVLLDVLLNRTRYGRHVCAVGSSERVAQFSAVAVHRIRTLTYVIAGATVAVSAVFWSARTNSINSTNFGQGEELNAIAAVIIGGTPINGGRGSVWGTVVGAVMLQIINNMLNMMSVSPYLQGTVKGLVIIVAALIQRRL
jgi:ribose transport system permease protein